MLDMTLSRAPWARSSSCPSTLLKKLFMVTDSGLQQDRAEGSAHPAGLSARVCAQEYSGRVQGLVASSLAGILQGRASKLLRNRGSG